MRKILLLVSILGTIFITGRLSAADYTSGLGMRAEAWDDSNIGVTFKHFIKKNIAGEGLLQTNIDNGLVLTGLAMYQAGFPGANPGLQWYIGGGWHIGSWGDDNDFITGPDGILGLEFTFREMPLTLAFDWHPVINIYADNEGHYLPIKFGLTARYCF